MTRPEPLAYTVKDVAGLMSLGTSQVYDLIRERALPAVRFGRALRVLRADLDAYLTRHRTAPADPDVNGQPQQSPPGQVTP